MRNEMRRQEEQEEEARERQRARWRQLTTRAIDYSDLKQYDKAITCCNEILEENSIYIHAWEIKAMVLKCKCLYDAALKCCDQVIKICKDHNIKNPDPIYNAWFSKADIYQLKGDHKNTIYSCQKARKSSLKVAESTDAETLNLLRWEGVALSKLKRYSEALNCFKFALKLSPGDKSSMEWKINALDELDRCDKALKCMHKFLKLYPNDDGAWNNKASILNKLHRYEEAISASEKSFSLDKHPYPLGHKGDALKGLGRYSEALEAYDAALKMDAEYKQAWKSKGDILVLQEKYLEAKKCYQSALSIDTSYEPAKKGKANIVKLFDEAWAKGDKFVEALDYENALKSYNQALKIDPDNATLWSNKGCVLNKLGCFKEAISSCDKAESLNQRHPFPNPLRHKGEALIQLGRYDEAHKCFDAALEEDSNYAEAWSSKGQLYNRQNNCEKALVCFEKAITLSPDLEEAKTGKVVALNMFGSLNAICCEGDLFALQNNTTMALQYYEKALQKNPNFRIALNKKAAILTQTHHFDAAITCCDHILKLDQNNKTAILNIGIALFRLNRLEEANYYFDLNPCLEALCYKGEILNLKADYSNSIIHFLKVIARDPSYEPAKSKLDKVIKNYQEQRQNQYALWQKGRELEEQNNLFEAINCYNKALNAIFLKKYERVTVLSLEDAIYHYIEFGNTEFGQSELLVSLEEDRAIVYSFVSGHVEFEFLTKEQFTEIFPILSSQEIISNTPELIQKIISICRAAYAHNLDKYIWEQKAQALLSMSIEDNNNCDSYMDEAVQCCDNAIEIDPAYVEAWITKAKVFRINEKYLESLECYQKALLLAPDRTDISQAKKDTLAELQKKKQLLIHQGNTLAQKKQNEEAIRLYLLALKLDPKDATLWLQQGNAYLELSRYTQAVYCYTKSLEIDPHNKYAWNHKSIALNAMSNFDEAIKCCDKCLSLLDNTWVEPLKNKGMAFLGKKLYNPALEAFRAYLSVHNTDTGICFVIADIYSTLNDDDNALSYYNYILKIDPVNTQAKRSINAIFRSRQMRNLLPIFIAEIQEYKTNLNENIKKFTLGPFTMFYNKELSAEKENLADNLINDLPTRTSLEEIIRLLDFYLQKDADLCRDYKIPVNIFSEKLNELKKQALAAWSLIPHVV